MPQNFGLKEVEKKTKLNFQNRFLFSDAVLQRKEKKLLLSLKCVKASEKKGNCLFFD